MKNLFTITKDEKKRILEMHKKAYQNNYLTEEENPDTYTIEELYDLMDTMNIKMTEVLNNKIDDALSGMKLVGRIMDETYQVFELWSPSNTKLIFQLLSDGTPGKLSLNDYFTIKISANKKMLIGSVDISSDIPTMISSLTERQKEIMDMDIPNAEGYTFNQLINEYKPTLALQGLPEQEGTIYAEVVKSSIDNDPYPVSACQGWPTYQMGVEFPITELIKTRPDANKKILKVCYGGLRLNNSSVYITTYPKPFNQMLKAKISDL